MEQSISKVTGEISPRYPSSKLVITSHQHSEASGILELPFRDQVHRLEFREDRKVKPVNRNCRNILLFTKLLGGGTRYFRSCDRWLCEGLNFQERMVGKYFRGTLRWTVNSYNNGMREIGIYFLWMTLRVTILWGMFSRLCFPCLWRLGTQRIGKRIPFHILFTKGGLPIVDAGPDFDIVNRGQTRWHLHTIFFCHK